MTVQILEREDLRMNAFFHPPNLCPPPCDPPDSTVLFSNATSLSLPMQPLWRFTDSPNDGRLLVYRSDDIRNLSRIASPKVCGYIHAETKDLLPQTARRDWDRQEEVGQENGELCSFPSLEMESTPHVCVRICACVVEMCRTKMG